MKTGENVFVHPGKNIFKNSNGFYKNHRLINVNIY